MPSCNKKSRPRTANLSALLESLIEAGIEFITPYGPLDVLAIIEQGRGYEDLLPDTVEIEFRGHKVRMLSLQTIVDLKEHSRDPKDRQRLPILQETLRQSKS